MFSFYTSWREVVRRTAINSQRYDGVRPAIAFSFISLPLLCANGKILL